MREAVDTIRTIRQIVGKKSGDQEVVLFNRANLDDNYIPVAQVTIKLELQRAIQGSSEIEFNRHIDRVQFRPGSDIELIEMVNQLSQIEVIEHIKLSAVNCNSSAVRLEITSQDEGLIEFLKRLDRRAA